MSLNGKATARKILRGRISGVDVVLVDAYAVAVRNGYKGTEQEWLASLVGKSAYEVAKAGGYEGTEEEWLASLVGADGAQGKDGKSAYEVACDHGFIGTEEEWLESLKGEDYDPALEETVSGLVDKMNALEGSIHHSYVDVLPEQAISGFDTDPFGANCITASIPDDIGLIVGETYRVLWNGAEFTCVCYGETASEDGTLTLTGAFLGNAAIAFDTLPDSGEPFVISSGSDGTYFRCASGESHTVGIYRVVEKSELPAIGYNDDGKILQVQNGEYVLAEMPESEGGTTEVAILEETTFDGFAYSEGDGSYAYNINPAPFTLVVGETYRVVWDETEYVCVAQDMSAIAEGIRGLGNMSNYGGTGNNEPFAIGWSEYGITLLSTDAESTHKVAIYQTVTAPTLPAVSSADNGKILQVVDGAWAAVADAVATDIDLSAYESDGIIVETFADGSSKTTAIEFDADGNPVKITDWNGNVTTLTW